MNKGRKKQTRNVYDAKRALAIKWTVEKHSVTPGYLRNLLNGNSRVDNEFTRQMLADYRAKYAELQKVFS